jgi:hypothetical protein
MFVLRPRPTDLAQGMTRRRWLELGLGGGALAGAFASAGAGASPAASGPAGFGRAKSCILIYLFGGPSHIDIWDMKPDAPDGIRGEFKPIATSVPGVRITEHLPRLAKQMDRLAIVRSMTHGDSSHGSASHTMMTGRRPRALGEVGPTPEDFPTFGSVIGRLRPPAGPLPPFVALPWVISTSTNLVPGQDGGFLGQGYDPFRISAPAATSNFFPPDLAVDKTLTAGRLDSRRALRSSLESARPAYDPQLDRDNSLIYRRAFDLLSAPDVVRAFRIDDEPEPVRRRYGLNPFGQSLLLARRLAEAGVPLITIYWPDRTEPEAFINNGVKDNVAVAAWDTHGTKVGATPNFPMLRDKNLPPLDLGSSALLDDLADRGLIDKTLVVWTGEFGRSPRINGDAGRDHYGNAFSLMLAGAGIKGGYVHGSTDRIGAFPATDPVSPAQFAATLYHSMGIRPDAEIHDGLNRPFRVAEADPISALFA